MMRWPFERHELNIWTRYVADLKENKKIIVKNSKWLKMNIQEELFDFQIEG